jgi:hypothetical protein
MAAVQVATTTTVLVTADPDQARTVSIANMGPQIVYVEVGAPAVIASSLPIPATTGRLDLLVPANTAVNAICSVLQVTPADTRVIAL